MDDPQFTCWTLIQLAADGEPEHRQAFARRYEPVVRAYLVARWRGSPLTASVDDATQVVFVECLKEGGVLAKATPDRAGGFRAFLYGAVRNVARRFEAEAIRNQQRQPASASVLETHPNDETRLSLAFDRTWARQIMKEAATRMSENAENGDDAATERVELLHLRFNENLPIRTIAQRWNRPAESLHRQYAKARKEFHQALLAVMAFHFPDDPVRAEQELTHLLAVLG